MSWLPRTRHRLPGAVEKARRPHYHRHPNLLIYLIHPLIYSIHLLMMRPNFLNAEGHQLLFVNAPVNHLFHRLCRLLPPPAWLMTRARRKRRKGPRRTPATLALPMRMWNIKITDYRRKDKKDKIWEDQAQLMEKTADILKGWFRSLCDTHTRLDKKKSGDGAPCPTEREGWIVSKFAFLKTVTRHRPESLQSVTIQLLYFFWTSLI